MTSGKAEQVRIPAGISRSGRRIASVVSAWLKTQAFILFLTSAVCIFGLAVIGIHIRFCLAAGSGSWTHCRYWGPGLC